MPEDFDESVDEVLENPFEDEDFDGVEEDDESLDPLDPFAPEKEEEDSF